MTQPSSPPAPSQQPQPRPLPPNFRPRLGIGLLVAAGLLAIIPIYSSIEYTWDFVWPVTVWGAVLALTALFGGLWAVLGEPETEARTREFLRLLALTVGGVAGLATALFGLGMAIVMYGGIFAGGLEVWRENALRVLVCAVALYGGLALMFVSLLLARPAERTSAGLRRLLYGTNAVLTGLLLLSILGVVNLLATVRLGPFSFFSREWDWTAAQIYSLKPATRNFLTKLDRPVKIYGMIQPGLSGYRETDALLDSFRNTSDKVTYVPVSRDLNPKDFEALLQKYKVKLQQGGGLLVVYGTEPGEQSEYIPYRELVKDETAVDPRTGQAQGPEKYLFTGEAALLKTLELLSEGKKVPVIYFTQGNGEPPLTPGRGRGGDSLNLLNVNLARNNYQIKPLNLTPETESIPDDAAVVVVANPHLGLPDKAVKVLTDYMQNARAGKTKDKAKGKLVVLLDVNIAADGKRMVRSGLEGLLATFNVRVPEERLIAAKPTPTELDVIPNIESSDPIAEHFQVRGRPVLFHFDDVRPVESLSPGGRYRVEPLLRVYRSAPIWRETDLRDPDLILREMLSPGRQEEALARAIKESVPVAVTVTEGGPLPEDRFHAGLTDPSREARLVVFGDADWITDGGLAQEGNLRFSLFISCLNWLRGKGALGEMPGTERQEFTLASVRTPEMVSRLRWVPLGLILVAIVALGGGIWVVRRR